MNFKLISALLLASSVASAQDIFLQTRVEQRTLSALIDKTRLLLSNSEINDHMSGEVALTEDSTFSMNDLANEGAYPKFRDLFASIFKLDLANAYVRVRIPKVAYQIGQLHAKPLSMNVQDPILDLNVRASLKGLTTSLSAGIDLDLMIVNPVTNQPESYLTAHLVPTTITIPDSLEPVSFDVQFETKRDQEFTYHLKGHDLTPIPSYIDRHMNEILIQESDKKVAISADSISVNPVTVRLSSLSRTISFDSFKPLIQKKFNTILSSVISRLGISVQDKIGPRILKGAFNSKTKSDFIVKNENLYTRFKTASFSQPVSDQLYLGVIGELCTAESYQQYHEQCDQQGNFPAPVRSISEGDRVKAKSEITEHLARGNSDLILSLSEEYLNRLLHITVQANLWNESMEPQHLSVGPKGAFLVFDQRTKTPELYLDVLYFGEGKGVQSWLVNENKPIRFPLRINTSIEFVDHEGTPHLVTKTRKILSTRDEIIHGIPEYNMPSKLLFGFKKKIARMILEMSEKVEGQTVVDLEIPTLKNMDMEKTWHEASPFGRLNLFFKL